MDWFISLMSFFFTVLFYDFHSKTNKYIQSSSNSMNSEICAMEKWTTVRQSKHYEWKNDRKSVNTDTYKNQNRVSVIRLKNYTLQQKITEHHGNRWQDITQNSKRKIKMYK